MCIGWRCLLTINWPASFASLYHIKIKFAFSIYRDPKSYTGNFAIDEDIVKAAGVKDLKPYACDPSKFLLLWNHLFLLHKDTYILDTKYNPNTHPLFYLRCASKVLNPWYLHQQETLICCLLVCSYIMVIIRIKLAELPCSLHGNAFFPR